MRLPRYIAICGNPKSGKSLVQEILRTDWGIEPVDDGEILRAIAIAHFGAKHDDVYTQEGKASLAYWPNGDPIFDYRGEQPEHLTWRRLLGNLGEQLEAMFGDFVMPMTACAKLDPKRIYSFGSVRKNQGIYFKKHDGLVIGVRNPDAPPTGNAFDVFDESLVDVWIDNDWLSKGIHPDAARILLAQEVDRIMVQQQDIRRAKLNWAA